ncbi:MAG: response regulator [Bacteroidota bacterium]|nr:response regulator [Bacteroidota bacterium]
MNQNINHILLVDDEEDSIFITKKLIQSVYPNMIISSFQNPLKAIEYLELNAKNTEILPDLVLLDLNMPLMNGWMFLESYNIIKEDFKKEITLYLLTSSVFDGDIKRSHSFPVVSYYLQKPIDMEIFQKLISKELLVS